jgi:hypothetical protein
MQFPFRSGAMPKSKINEGKYTQKLRPTEKQTCSPLSDYTGTQL